MQTIKMNARNYTTLNWFYTRKEKKLYLYVPVIQQCMSHDNYMLEMVAPSNEQYAAFLSDTANIQTSRYSEWPTIN